MPPSLSGDCEVQTRGGKIAQKPEDIDLSGELTVMQLIDSISHI